MVLKKLKKLFSIRTPGPLGEEEQQQQQPRTEEQKTNKHSSYFTVVMAEVKISQYFTTAEEVTKLMQHSTLQFCTVIKQWRGTTVRNFELLKVPDEDQLTQFGKWIIQTSQAFGHKGVESSSLTQSQYESNFEAMISLAKEAAKLRRKLGRISDGFVEDLKKLKLLVESRNLEGKGSVIYDTTSPAPLVPVSSSGLIEPVSSYQHIKTRLKDAIQGGRQTRPKGTKKLDMESYNNPSQRNYISSSAIDLKTPAANPSKKHLQRLAEEFQGFLVSFKEYEAQEKKDNPSVQVLHENINLAISSDVTEEDHVKSFETKEDSKTLSFNANNSKNYFHFKRSSIRTKEKMEEISEVRSTNANECALGKQISSHLEISQGNYDDDLATKNPLPLIDEAKSDDSVSEDSEAPLDCKTLLAHMHMTASSVVTLVRSVERSWMTIPKPNPDSSSSAFIETKLYDLLQYIMETVKLWERGGLDYEITAERKDRLYTALHVVYKEMYTCFVTVAELTQMVSTDVAYLKELMTLIKARLDSTSDTNGSAQNDSNVLIEPERYYRVDLNNIFD